MSAILIFLFCFVVTYSLKLVPQTINKANVLCRSFSGGQNVNVLEL